MKAPFPSQNIRYHQDHSNKVNNTQASYSHNQSHESSIASPPRPYITQFLNHRAQGKTAPKSEPKPCNSTRIEKESIAQRSHSIGYKNKQLLDMQLKERQLQSPMTTPKHKERKKSANFKNDPGSNRNSESDKIVPYPGELLPS